MQHEGWLLLQLQTSAQRCHLWLTILVKPKLCPAYWYEDGLRTYAVVGYYLVVCYDQLCPSLADVRSHIKLFVIPVSDFGWMWRDGDARFREVEEANLRLVGRQYLQNAQGALIALWPKLVSSKFSSTKLFRPHTRFLLPTTNFLLLVGLRHDIVSFRRVRLLASLLVAVASGRVLTALDPSHRKVYACHICHEARLVVN